MRNEEITAVFDRQAASYDQQWSRLAPINDALHLLTSAVLAKLPPTAKILCVGAGTGQEALPFRSGLIDQAVLAMNPDYGARLQLQKIVMLDVADIVVVNKTDLDRARVALSEIEHRLGQNKRDQQLVATVAKRHRDPGVDELYEMITANSGGGKK